MDNKEVWKTALDIDEIENDNSVKATYDNSFCMDSNCINYFEDSCMEALTDKGTEIKPFTDKERDSNECGEFKSGTFLVYEVDLTDEDFKEEVTYKIATKYKYVGDSEVVKPGDIFKKDSTIGYDSFEGEEVTLKQLGKLYIAVDKMMYDFSNQWENGMNPFEFLEDVINLMKGDR